MNEPRTNLDAMSRCTETPPSPREAERLISALLPRMPKTSPEERDDNHVLPNVPFESRLEDRYNMMSKCSNYFELPVTTAHTTLPIIQGKDMRNSDAEPIFAQPRYGSLPYCHTTYPLISAADALTRTKSYTAKMAHDDYADDADEDDARGKSAEHSRFREKIKQSRAVCREFINGDSALLMPGSTKVLRPRRRKSSDSSPLRAAEPTDPKSTSYSRLVEEGEASQAAAEVPACKADSSIYATYVVRKSHPKAASCCDAVDGEARTASPEMLRPEMKKHSTFDNITDLACSSEVVRVVSLPSIAREDSLFSTRDDLPAMKEEEVDSSGHTSAEMSPLRKIERNISELLERRDIEISSVVKNEMHVLQVNGSDKMSELNRIPVSRAWKSYKDTMELRGLKLSRAKEERCRSAKCVGLTEATADAADDEVPGELPLPPLPPSPVEEDDEYSEVLLSSSRRRRSSSNEPAEHRTSSLAIVKPCVKPCAKARQQVVNCAKQNRYHHEKAYSAPVERRTLPTDLPMIRKRIVPKFSPTTEHHTMQTSCSLPETPVFMRGCDLLRTPHRKPADGQLLNEGSICGTFDRWKKTATVEKGCSSEVQTGADLARLLGGPGRGWYPKQRQLRPVSTEHLDCLPATSSWGMVQRKPQTLPPNLAPNFFKRSPREALRRVTSLLIRKGSNNVSNENHQTTPKPKPKIDNEIVCEKRKGGFFRKLWTRSKHRS